MKLSDSDKRLLQQMQNVKSSFKRVLEVILTKFTRKMLLAVAGILVTFFLNYFLRKSFIL